MAAEPQDGRRRRRLFGGRQLRADRAASGPGRIYTITIRATDAAGNTNTATVQVPVPHDSR